jgi:hypothetical protein
MPFSENNEQHAFGSEYCIAGSEGVLYFIDVDGLAAAVEIIGALPSSGWKKQKHLLRCIIF